MKNKGIIRFFHRVSGREKKAAVEEFNTLTGEKQEMIRGVVELSDTTVKEVMVPRIDVVFVPFDLPYAELVTKVADCGHSRFPVYKETIDNVIGVLYAKDLLRSALQLDQSPESRVVESIIRKPYFVPESMRLDSLLREMKRRRVHIAVAVDEYGGVSGIVCMEDIIEEIIGDIQDEFDNEREDVLTIGDGVFLCDARVNLDDLADETGCQLPNDDFDTLGGFVFDLFGKIPVKFEKVNHQGWSFIIQDMDNHKIKTVKIVRNPEEKESNLHE